MDPNEAELESFRRQWREEVKSRSKTKANLDSARRLYDHSQKLPATPPLKPGLQKHHFHTQKNDGEQQVQWRREPAQSTLYEETKNHENANNLGKGVSSSPEIQRAEPETALEHYEMAVEREGQGSLGDSVRLYRKAFRVSVSCKALCSNADPRTRWTTVSMRHTRTNISLRHIQKERALFPRPLAGPKRTILKVSRCASGSSTN